jgi:formamidopyrimidine-DNA glycosylase
MPELPEVETIARDLQKLSGQKISKLKVAPYKIFLPVGPKLAELVRGSIIKSVSRRAKLVVVELMLRQDYKKSRQAFLIVHLKMTGQLVLRHKRAIIFGGHPIVGVTQVPNKYTHAEFHLKSGDVLYFNDLRRFGYIRLLSPLEFSATIEKLGVEPLTADFTLEKFTNILRKRPKSVVKAALLDQAGVAGIGNIYVDEACWRAGIRPTRRVKTLTKDEIKKLWKAIKGVLALSIKHRGTSFNSYVDTDGKTGGFWKHRKVYGRKGEVCRRCGDTILKTVAAGRGTHYCPSCQA